MLCDVKITGNGGLTTKLDVLKCFISKSLDYDYVWKESPNILP